MATLATLTRRSAQPATIVFHAAETMAAADFTGTTPKTSGIADIAFSRDLTLYFKNTLNQTVTVDVYASPDADGSDSYLLKTITLTAGNVTAQKALRTLHDAHDYLFYVITPAAGVASGAMVVRLTSRRME